LYRLTYIDLNVEIDFPRDRKDAKFLACAMAGDADFLITGDSDFSQAQNLVNTTIISVFLSSSMKRLPPHRQVGGEMNRGSKTQHPLTSILR
jgi:predicted nucleic acid-binding protein